MTALPMPTFDPGFSTEPMMRVWSPASRLTAMLEFEASLALALADAGVAPSDEARAVADACAPAGLDPDGVMSSTWTTGTPLSPILETVGRRIEDPGARRWLHHGTTTQDVVDTAQMLQSREGLDILDASLTRLATALFELLNANADQGQMGRTFLQHAQPTSLGLRFARWLSSTLHHIIALRQARQGLPVQLGGPVGDRAGLGDQAQAVVEALAHRLDLVPTTLAWHTDRSPVSSLASAINSAVRSMAKIAMDIALLAQTDTAEITVRGGVSSSMPHKRNPIDSVRALAAADACAGASAMITNARPHELDRALGAWHVEWIALPLVFHCASAAIESVEKAVSSLEVESDRMTGRVTGAEDRSGASTAQIESVIATYHEVLGNR